MQARAANWVRNTRFCFLRCGSGRKRYRYLGPDVNPPPSKPVYIYGWRECRATVKKSHILAIRIGIYTLAVLLVSIPALEGQNQTVGLFLNNAAKTAPGYVLLPPMHNGHTYLIDNNGQVVNSWYAVATAAASRSTTGRVISCGSSTTPPRCTRCTTT